MSTGSPENPVANRPSPFPGPRPTLDFDEKPMVVIWEVTQACDLSCYHCRASAQPMRNCMELTTAQGRRLIDEIAAMRTPIFPSRGTKASRSRWFRRVTVVLIYTGRWHSCAQRAASMVCW